VSDNHLGLDQQHYVDDRQAASILGLSRSSLRQLRVSGGGCRFSRFGRAIRYRVGDLLDWAEGQGVRSTSDRQSTPDPGGL
jgi:Helix-turn-helix domain